MPKFVWVCELYSRKSWVEKKVIGEIVFDEPLMEKIRLKCIVFLTKVLKNLSISLVLGILIENFGSQWICLFTAKIPIYKKSLGVSKYIYVIHT